MNGTHISPLPETYRKPITPMSKPELHALGPNPTVEQIIALYRKLTGKEPTQAEIDELKARAVMGKPVGAVSEMPLGRSVNDYERVITPDADLANADWPKRTKDVKTPSGFTLIEALVVLAIIAVLVALLVPAVAAAKKAAGNKKPEPTSYVIGEGVHGFRTIKIDGCEYVEYSEGFFSNEHRVYCITHKGNCSNPIHKYNTEQP